MSYGGLRNQHYQVFRYVAGSYDDDLTFAHSFSAPVLASLNRTVTFSKHVFRTAFDIKAPFSAEELTEFIDRQYYNLQSLDSKTLKRMMTIEPATLLMIHPDPALQSVVDFQRTADSLWRQVLSVCTPLTNAKSMKKLIRFLGIGDSLEEDKPIMRIIERRNDRIYKFKMEESEINEETIIQFFNDFKNGLLKPYFKSESPQAYRESERDSTIKSLVGKNFEEGVMTGFKDVIVFFYSVWCVDCPDVLKIYESLADKYSDTSDLSFNKIDCFNNEGEDIPEAIYGEPILKIYKADDKTKPVEFTGNYVISEVEEWLSKHLVLEGADL